MMTYGSWFYNEKISVKILEPWNFHKIKKNLFQTLVFVRIIRKIQNVCLNLIGVIFAWISKFIKRWRGGQKIGNTGLKKKHSWSPSKMLPIDIMLNTSSLKLCRYLPSAEYWLSLIFLGREIPYKVARNFGASGTIFPHGVCAAMPGACAARILLTAWFLL